MLSQAGVADGFAPDEVGCLRFVAAEVGSDSDGLTATWRYALDDRPFVERLRFPGLPAPGDLPAARAAALERVLGLAFLIAGTSYYKAAAPPLLLDETGWLAAAGPQRIREIYLHGLAEYAYRNRLDLEPRLTFRCAVTRAAQPVSGLGLAERALVPVGGGKDSAVTVEAARSHGDPLLFTVGAHRAVLDTAAAAGLPLVRAVRTLDPELLALNAAGARNGHVPVTAVVTLLATAAAIGHGCGAVLMSNERSASEPNLTWNGLPVNHQWSKGARAEALLAELVADVVTDEVAVFSLLRPLSEVAIARRFAATERYDAVVTSCNAAFRLEEGRRVSRWCGHCPKCRFVFLVLAGPMGRERVRRVFEGRDLLADPAQADGYLELFGVVGDKPFECVGELVESRVALRLAAQTGDWADSPELATLVERVRGAGWPSDADVTAVLTPGPSRIPAGWAAALER